MKINLIIPMAGVGKRFLDKNYISNKSLLMTDNTLSILEKIIINFDIKKTNFYLILSNKDLAKKIKIYFSNYNLKIIIIEKHNKGPLNSILTPLKNFKKRKSKFLLYSDIIWSWNFNRVLKYINSKNIVVFTHKDFILT